MGGSRGGKPVRGLGGIECLLSDRGRTRGLGSCPNGQQGAAPCEPGVKLRKAFANSVRIEAGEGLTSRRLGVALCSSGAHGVGRARDTRQVHNTTELHAALDDGGVGAIEMFRGLYNLTDEPGLGCTPVPPPGYPPMGPPFLCVCPLSPSDAADACLGVSSVARVHA